MMIRDHFPNCREMPEDIQSKFHTLKRKPKNVGHCVVTSSGGGGKKKKNASRLSGAGSGLGNAARYTKNYWTESAQRIGLYDSPDGNGIRYHNAMGVATAAPAPASTASQGPSDEGVSSVHIADEDKQDAINAAIDAVEAATEEASSKRRKVGDASETLDDPVESEAV